MESSVADFGYVFLCQLFQMQELHRFKNLVHHLSVKLVQVVVFL